MAERDLSFEALVSATSASIPAERGAVNVALAAIRAAMPEMSDEDLAAEIRRRAYAYRKAWPALTLTPTALSKHWARIQEEAKPTRLPPQHPESFWLCGLCDNGAWVMVEGAQEVVPCPECDRGHRAEVAAYRYEGAFWTGRTWLRSTEPNTVVVT